MAQDFTPERDASLGLVFRLNNLWALIDYAVINADYKKWDVLLDRLYCNLLYKEDMIVEENGGKITKVELSIKDTKVYSFLSKQINKAKSDYNNCSSMNKSKYRSIWYHAIQKKDIWLRKKMQELKLYLKENIKTPGSAMFGNFGKWK